MKYYKLLIISFILTLTVVLLPYNKEYQVKYNTYYEENASSLISISINNNNFKDFNPETYSYSLNTNDDTIRISGTCSGNVAANGVGVKPLTVGSNEFKISCGNNPTEYTIKVTRTEDASTDATLKSLKIENISISPTFSPTVLSYTATTNQSSVIIYAVANNAKSKVTGAGKVSLKDGINTAIIKVASESGVSKNYKIIINKKNPPALKNITFSEDTDFEGLEENGTKYTINVAASVKTIKVTPILGNSTYSFVRNYGAREVSLMDGENEVLIKVKQTDGQVVTYTLTIIKDISSDNNYLSTLKLSSGKIKFDKEKTLYKTEVLYNVKNIKIDAIAEDPESKVKINNVKELVVGNNTITIEVTATNNEKKIYTIVVKRLKQGQKLTDKVSLKSLSIKDYKLDFKSTIYKYNLKIKKNTDKLNISYKLENITDKVTIKGNKNLKDGSKITITVTDENGSSTDYIINITKQSTDIVFIILIIIFILGLGLLVFIIIYMKKKKDSNLLENSNEKTTKNKKEIEPIEDKTKEFDMDLL